MQLNSYRLTTPVSVVRLILAVTVLAVIGPAITDRPASARSTVEPTSVEAAATVEVEAVPVSSSTSSFDVASWADGELGGVDPDVFSLALQAASAAVERGDARNPGTLTVIDFSRPSTVERMWVYDLATRELLFKEFVSHGRGSGRTDATMFSNVPESNQSSLGLYRTAETYIGKHGYSLRLDGLERGINDRARERAIVMHGAEYVNAAAAKAQGYLGRSLGCPAVRPEVTRELIEAVKDGGLLFAYYPDPAWLSESAYLN
jgi:hypothetical protein